MCKNKDDMNTKLNRKNRGIILGIPVWKKVALARYHCGYDASFFNFPFQFFTIGVQGLAAQRLLANATN